MEFYDYFGEKIKDVIQPEILSFLETKIIEEIDS